MRFLLDTNAVSAVMRRDAGVIGKVQQYGPPQIGMSALTVYELCRGAWRAPEARRPRILEAIEALPFEVLPFSGKAAREAGKGAGLLLSSGNGIDDMDALIAAHAQSQGLTVVTRNLKHFERWPGLHVVNWEA